MTDPVSEAAARLRELLPWRHLSFNRERQYKVLVDESLPSILDALDAAQARVRELEAALDIVRALIKKHSPVQEDRT